MRADSQDFPHAKLVRLSNGDDVVCELVELAEDDVVEQYLLINPLKVMYVGTEHPGYLQIAFLPFVFPKLCSEQQFVLGAKDVMFIANVSNSMNNHYWENLDALQENSDPVSTLRKALAEQFEESDDMDSEKTYH